MLDFTRVVADALTDSPASYLRALEDSVSDIDNTRTRMETAQRAYWELRAAQDMEVGQPVVCGVQVHEWGSPHLVPSVPVNGVERDPKFVTLEACPGCGSLKVQTSNTGKPADWDTQYLRR